MPGSGWRRYPHLPEGHLPGPQSRSRYGISGLFLRSLPLLLGASSVGGAVAFLVVASSTPESAWGALIMAVAFAGLGIYLMRLGLHALKRAADKPASHLQLVVTPVDVRRGEAVNATLSITDISKVGQHPVQVGLVCTEWYEEQTSAGGHSFPVTSEAVAYEKWVAAEPESDPQSFTFSVPADSPFSYEGTMLSFGWRVTARQARSSDIGPVTNLPIWVRP